MVGRKINGKKCCFSLLLVGILLFSSCTDNTNPVETTPEPTQGQQLDMTTNYTVLETGISWPEGQIFPSFAEPADTLYRININLASDSKRLAALSLEGIVNAQKPRIITTASATINDWIENLNLQTEKISVDDAILKFKDEINGLIIYDKNLEDTINIASTHAGIAKGIVVDADYAQTLQQEPYNLKVIADYTGMFSDKLEMYQYMYDNLWSQCNHRLFAGIAPGITYAYRDMGIATKSLFIYLDPTIPKEAKMLSKFAADCTPGETYYAGWWPKDEFGGLELFGRQYGICTIATDYFYNMTVFAGTSKEINMKAIPEVPELENKIYVAVMFSEGDNLQYDMNTMYEIWSGEERGEVPITWSIAPSLYDAAPGMLNYYYQTATENDCFITGPSGGAFILSETWKDETWIDKFTKMTNRYCIASGIRLGNVWNSLKDPIWSYYGKNCRFLWGVTEISHDSSLSNPMNEGYLLGVTLNPGYHRFQSDYDGALNNIRGQIGYFDGSSPKFIFTQGLTWETEISDFIKLKRDLVNRYGEENVEFVRGDHLILLMQQYYKLPVNIAGAYLNTNVSVETSSNREERGKLTDSLYSTQSNLWVSEQGEQHVITVDLGQELSVYRYVVMHGGVANLPKAYNTRAFTVEYSTDGSTWERLDQVTDNTEDITDRDVDRTKARYVRFTITDAGADDIARIAEIEIYGRYQ